jgi:hypothetical protein
MGNGPCLSSLHHVTCLADPLSSAIGSPYPTTSAGMSPYSYQASQARSGLATSYTPSTLFPP